MQYGKIMAAESQRRTDLQDAAWISGCHHFGAARHHRVGLALAEPPRHLRLGEVVSAGAAAAELAVGELDELETSHRAQQRTRLAAYTLTVREVARVVVR